MSEAIMNAQGILDRIEKDARRAASQTLEDAQRRADTLRKESDARIEQSQQAALDQARRDAAAMDDRTQRMAKLDARKALLAAKRGVLDEAFTKALDRMAAMPDDQARAFGLSMLLDSAAGDEQLVPDGASGWCDQAFVDAANAALVKAGKPGKITLSAERRALGGGFVLTRGGMEINCSYPAALDARRGDIEGEVAGLLFDA